MELSRKCKEYWGIDYHKTPFGKTIEEPAGLFVWDEFDDLIENICTAIRKRRFIVLLGAPCSAKSTAWDMAKQRLWSQEQEPRFCQPFGLNPQDYTEMTIYRSIIHGIDDLAKVPVSREQRARQTRTMLEEQNARGHAVVLAINDAHACRLPFLLMAKRLWDDLDGFDRLLSVFMIGHPHLLTTLSGCPEINERTEVLQTPGLCAFVNGKLHHSHIDDYLHHEMGRCGATELPFDSSAIDALVRLAKPSWRQTQDHPLVINNIVSRALHDAWKIKAPSIDAELVTQASRAESSI